MLQQQIQASTRYVCTTKVFAFDVEFENPKKKSQMMFQLVCV